MNILITGANGLLGRQICDDCNKNEHNVFGLTHLMPSDPLQGVTHLPMDFNSGWRTEDLPEHVDAIIHLAQSPNFRDFPNSALEVFRVNLESTAKLLDYAKNIGVRKFILASSGGLYGISGRPHTELSPTSSPDKLDYYLASKLACEMLMLNYSRIFQTIILRFFFIYGPRQKKTMLIPRLLDNIKQEKAINLQGADGIRINPIHVADASIAVLASLETDESDIINIAGPDSLSIRQICESMGSVLEIAPKFDIQPGDPTALIGDIQRMKGKLHIPKIKLTDSISELLHPYNESGTG